MCQQMLVERGGIEILRIRQGFLVVARFQQDFTASKLVPKQTRSLVQATAKKIVQYKAKIISTTQNINTFTSLDL